MIYQNGETYRAAIRSCVAALLMTVVTPSGWAQGEVKEEGERKNSPEPGVIELKNDVKVEAGKEGEVEIRTFKGPVRAPDGVDVISPDEDDVVIDIRPKKVAPPTGPKPPKGPKKTIIIGKEGGEDAVARRLERLEQKLDAMAERERMSRKSELALNDRAMAKVQREIDRAVREADMAVRKFQFAHPGGEDEFRFEHQIAVAGSAKAQRKALEAQRKALEKQLEAIDQRIEKLNETENEGLREDEVEGAKVEEEKRSNNDEKPSLPPEAAP